MVSADMDSVCMETIVYFEVLSLFAVSKSVFLSARSDPQVRQYDGGKHPGPIRFDP